MSFLSRPRFLLLFGLIFIPLLGCDPCRTLADKICECEETSAARDNCHKTLDVFSSSPSFGVASKTEMCRMALENKDCSCLALRNGQLENCGLTRKAVTP
jgi:hypothetical protein